MATDGRTFDIETDPIGWRLDQKAALLKDELSPHLLLEMSREGIRGIRNVVPIAEDIQKRAPGKYNVNLNELSELERMQATLKNAPEGQYSYEDHLDHTVDVMALLKRVGTAMDRFNEDHKQFLKAPGGRTPVTQGRFSAGWLIVAAIAILFLARSCGAF